MKYYDEQLQTLQQQLARKKHLEALLQDLRRQKAEIEEKVARLKTIRDKEQSDVERLEGRGLIAFFYSVVGKKEEKLDEQRREASTAAVKYDVAMQELDLVLRRIGKYESELATLQGCEMKYAYTLKEKVKAIKALNSPAVEKILMYEEQIANLENQKKEIREAISAGSKSKSIAEQVLSELDDAEGWGTWDLLGGGMLSDLAKHSSLDDAQEEIEHLQVQLRRFKTELADVTIRADMQVNIDGFLRFADYFFDGLFADWAVLDRIEESQAEVKKTIQQIQSVLDKLNSMLNLVPLESYNQCMGTQEALAEDEVMIYCVRRGYDDATIALSDGTVWQVKKQLDDMMGSGDAAMNVIPSVFVVVPDFNKAIDAFNAELGNISEQYLCRPELQYGFDADIPSEEQISLSNAISERLRELDVSGDGGFYSSNVESKEQERADYYGLFGGILYLGAFLSIIFVAATVLIIYYKQLTEGYEDEARFGIMRKVGMTTKDIRKSINSQMLTVFFLPLGTAAIHVGFAFPMVQKLLAMFNLRNTMLSVLVTGVAIVIFGIFYAIVYKLTSNAYYSVVTGKKENNV